MSHTGYLASVCSFAPRFSVTFRIHIFNFIETPHIIKGRCRVLYGIVVKCFCLFPHHEGSAAAATRPSCTEDCLPSSGIIPGKSRCDQSCHKIRPYKTCYGGKTDLSDASPWAHKDCLYHSESLDPHQGELLQEHFIWHSIIEHDYKAKDILYWSHCLGFIFVGCIRNWDFSQSNSILWPFVSHMQNETSLLLTLVPADAFWWLPHSASCLSFEPCSNDLWWTLVFPCFCLLEEGYSDVWGSWRRHLGVPNLRSVSLSNLVIHLEKCLKDLAIIMWRFCLFQRLHI